MADRTVAARARRQRDLRVAEGWQEVKVWVPTDADADDVRKLAAERRTRAETLYGLSEKVKLVTPETQTQIAEAILNQGSAAYTTPSGPVLDLMTRLLDADDLVGFSVAFVIFARAKPGNAAFVESAVPAKISNFLAKHRRVDSKALTDWAQSNPDWAEDLKARVRDPSRFADTVEQMAVAINRSVAN
jgi:hypothetical protein